jgi:hypothetical protein
MDELNRFMSLVQREFIGEHHIREMVTQRRSVLRGEQFQQSVAVRLSGVVNSYQPRAGVLPHASWFPHPSAKDAAAWNTSDIELKWTMQHVGTSQKRKACRLNPGRMKGVQQRGRPAVEPLVREDRSRRERLRVEVRPITAALRRITCLERFWGNRECRSRDWPRRRSWRLRFEHGDTVGTVLRRFVETLCQVRAVTGLD